MNKLRYASHAVEEYALKQLRITRPEKIRLDSPTEQVRANFRVDITRKRESNITVIVRLIFSHLTMMLKSACEAMQVANYRESITPFPRGVLSCFSKANATFNYESFNFYFLCCRHHSLRNCIWSSIQSETSLKVSKISSSTGFEVGYCRISDLCFSFWAHRYSHSS
jgi:hypothetical protein